MVERFMPLAYRLARRYQRPGEPLEDLAQVATIGLLKALDRFDPERGHEFLAYAAPTILGELKRYFRDFGWVMHLSRGDQELAGEVKCAAEEASRRLGRAPTPEEIAAATRLNVEEVVRGLDAASAARPASLDVAAASTDGATAGAAEAWLGRDEEGFELVETRDAVSRGLHRLTKRDSQVLYMRFYEDLTQAEIAERIGLSQMQVSRIIRRSLDPSRWLGELQPV
ncbi:MAG TPA: sigma-70 family RNA polymerase sigma factor [Thermoleophilaceae bacterium]